MREGFAACISSLNWFSHRALLLAEGEVWTRRMASNNPNLAWMKLPPYFIFTTDSSVKQKWFTWGTSHSFVPLTAKRPWPFAILPPSALIHFTSPSPCPALIFLLIYPTVEQSNQGLLSKKKRNFTNSEGNSEKRVLVAARRGTGLWKPMLLWEQLRTWKGPFRMMVIFGNSPHGLIPRQSLCPMCRLCSSGHLLHFPLPPTLLA